MTVDVRPEGQYATDGTSETTSDVEAEAATEQSEGTDVHEGTEQPLFGNGETPSNGDAAEEKGTSKASTPRSGTRRSSAKS